MVLLNWGIERNSHITVLIIDLQNRLVKMWATPNICVALNKERECISTDFF